MIRKSSLVELRLAEVFVFGTHFVTCCCCRHALLLTNTHSGFDVAEDAVGKDLWAEAQKDQARKAQERREKEKVVCVGEGEGGKCYMYGQR